MQNQDHNLSEGHVEDENISQESDIKAENIPNPDEKTEDQVIKDFEQKLNESNDKYLRLYSEFDNYRKRTLKEKSEIIKTAAEDVFKSILPILDDFDRAMKANEVNLDSNLFKEGVLLIFNKLKTNTHQKGLISFESIGQVFDPELMEAITHIPSTDASQKGIVIDEIEKGYKLGEKVIRFAKVVVAQ